MLNFNFRSYTQISHGKGYSIDSYPQIMYDLFSYKIVYDALTAGMSTFVKFYSLTGINKFIIFALSYSIIIFSISCPLFVKARQCSGRRCPGAHKTTGNASCRKCTPVA